MKFFGRNSSAGQGCLLEGRSMLAFQGKVGQCTMSGLKLGSHVECNVRREEVNRHLQDSKGPCWVATLPLLLLLV